MTSLPPSPTPEAEAAPHPGSFPWAILATVLVLLGALEGHLLAALLAGLLVHQLVLKLAKRWRAPRARLWAAALLGGLVIVGLSVMTIGLIALLDGANGLTGLMQTATQVIQQFRSSLPTWIGEHLPEAAALQSSLGHWVQQHSASLQTLGRHTLEELVRIFLGMVLGALIALAEQHPVQERSWLHAQICHQARAVAEAFDRVVFAQVKISLVNTLLTAIFLFVALPLFGIYLPFAKTLVLLTFLMGLLPVVGNLISNTIIVLMGLSLSMGVATAALVFLILIHKLEYFLNARIVGHEIEAKTWEILLAMLISEAFLGMPGVILAPITYAYLKHELKITGWL